MGDSLVALAAVVCIFGLPVFGWIATRVLAHRERMELIRHGIVPPGTGVPPPPRDWRKGAAAPAPPLDYNPAAANRCLHRAIRLTMVGFAVTLGLSFIGYRDGTIEPGPWLLGGLIPTFIGVAQIISALLNGATLRMPVYGPPTAPTYNVSPPEPPPPPGSAAYEGSYTYRPGSAQELRPPPFPPSERK